MFCHRGQQRPPERQARNPAIQAGARKPQTSTHTPGNSESMTQPPRGVKYNILSHLPPPSLTLSSLPIMPSQPLSLTSPPMPNAPPASSYTRSQSSALSTDAVELESSHEHLVKPSWVIREKIMAQRDDLRCPTVLSKVVSEVGL